MLVPLRSTAKPFILTSLLETVLSKEVFTDREIAVMTSSHNGEPAHVRVVRGLLDKFSIPETALYCGIHEAFAKDSEISPVGNQCSGKHAMFLIATKIAGWSFDSYRSVGSPLQALISARLNELFFSSDLHVGVDGCSIPTYAISLRSLAKAYASLAAGHCGPAAACVVRAIQRQPFYIGGTDCLDTYLNQTYGCVAKSGSDGVWAIGVPSRSLGLAAKVVSGDEPAAQAALLECLDRLTVVSIASDEVLSRFHKRIARSLTGSPVGEIETCLPRFPLP